MRTISLLYRHSRPDAFRAMTIERVRMCATSNKTKSKSKGRKKNAQIYHARLIPSSRFIRIRRTSGGTRDTKYTTVLFIEHFRKDETVVAHRSVRLFFWRARACAIYTSFNERQLLGQIQHASGEIIDIIAPSGLVPGDTQRLRTNRPAGIVPQGRDERAMDSIRHHTAQNRLLLHALHLRSQSAHTNVYVFHQKRTLNSQPTLTRNPGAFIWR